MKVRTINLLDVSSGSVIFVSRHELTEHQMVEIARTGFDSLPPDKRPKNVKLIPVDDPDASLVTVADAETMNAAGWYRKQ